MRTQGRLPVPILAIGVYTWSLGNEGALFVISQDGDVRAMSSVDGRILIWENIRLQRFVNAVPISSMTEKHARVTSANT